MNSTAIGTIGFGYGPRPKADGFMASATASVTAKIVRSVDLCTALLLNRETNKKMLPFLYVQWNIAIANSILSTIFLLL